MTQFWRRSCLFLPLLLLSLLNSMPCVTLNKVKGKGQIEHSDSYEYSRRTKESYGFYYAEDLENVADDDFHDQSGYFLKTRHFATASTTTTTSTPLPKVELAITLPPTTPAPDESVKNDASLNIPGDPGIDYPIYSEVPSTNFNCKKQRYKGFFADLETNCQAWHYCDFTDGHSTFLCPNGTLFSQVLLICDWWFNVNCHEAQQLYVLNERLYRYVQPPKPTFPEDFHGPEVDLWLKRQLQLGILPKISKTNKLRDND